jgi:hypothetical protein
VLGKTLTLNVNNLTVIGVMAEDFSFNKEVMPAVNGIQRAISCFRCRCPQATRANRGGEDYNIFALLQTRRHRAARAL